MKNFLINALILLASLTLIGIAAGGRESTVISNNFTEIDNYNFAPPLYGHFSEAMKLG